MFTIGGVALVSGKTVIVAPGKGLKSGASVGTAGGRVVDDVAVVSVTVLCTTEADSDGDGAADGGVETDTGGTPRPASGDAPPTLAVGGSLAIMAIWLGTDWTGWI
jgi:hypothetical protein